MTVVGCTKRTSPSRRSMSAFGQSGHCNCRVRCPLLASEISSLDFFNLLWAGIAMLIAFIAFLVCFELPRGEALFAVDEAAKLALDDDVISGLVTGLST